MNNQSSDPSSTPSVNHSPQSEGADRGYRPTAESTAERGRLPRWLTRQGMNEIIFGYDTPAGKGFDICIICIVLLSVLMAFAESASTLAPGLKRWLGALEYVITACFTIEYIARLYCHPKPWRYALSFFGVIDLLATLPLYLSFILPEARYLVLLRMFRVTRVFLIFKLFTFTNEGWLMLESIRLSMKRIAVFFLFVFTLDICIGALIYMMEGNREGTAFTSLGVSVYWAIVTMTTVGYGDITPTTDIGRLLASAVMILGYTIIAVPTGIIAATTIDTTRDKVRHGRCPRCHEHVRRGDTYCAHCGEKL